MSKICYEIVYIVSFFQVMNSVASWNWSESQMLLQQNLQQWKPLNTTNQVGNQQTFAFYLYIGRNTLCGTYQYEKLKVAHSFSRSFSTDTHREKMSVWRKAIKCVNIYIVMPRFDGFDD